jgi:hypothetical protein
MKKIAFAISRAPERSNCTPAQADLGHNIWANNQNGHSVTAAQVDTTVHQSR